LRKTASPDLDAIETLLRKGRARCREHGDCGFELRVTESLSALLIRRHKPEEARLLLQETLDGYTEGFDTFYVARAMETLNALKGR